MARPLVPRPGVVPCSVAGGAKCEGRASGARAGVAVGAHLGTRRRADSRADFLRRLGQARPVKQRLLVDPSRSGNVSLTRIAGVAPLAVELLFGADVEQREAVVAEAPLDFLAGREGVQPRLEL